MNSFFFLSFLSLGVLASGYSHSYHYAPAPLGHDGQVIDTPEVAHAKAAHLAALNAAAAHSAHYTHGPIDYHHGYKTAPLDHDGRVVDTPEVAQAKAAHFAAKAAAESHSSYVAPVAYHSPIYSAPHHYAPAPLDHDGQVIDTPEVAHAKAAHFAAKADAAAHSSHYAYAPAHYAHDSAHYAHEAAPIGHDGLVVDTPEVAHAKAAHFAAKAAAGAHHY